MITSMHHSFDIHLAAEYGIEGALLIHHFQHWIMVNKRLNQNLFDGRTWTYQTLAEIAAHFPYLSTPQVKRTIQKLCDKEVLVKGNYNKNSHNRTVWYAFKDEKMFAIFRNRKMEIPESENGDGEIGKCTIKEKILKTDTKNTGGEADASTPPSPDISDKFNKKTNTPSVEPLFTHGSKIKMPMSCYHSLIASYGEAKIKEYLSLMEDYLDAHGKRYKDYAAALRQWIKRDSKGKGENGDVESNEEFAKKIVENYSLVRAKQLSVRLEALHNRLLIESTHPTWSMPATEIHYKENGFKEQVENALRKWRMK